MGGRELSAEKQRQLWIPAGFAHGIFRHQCIAEVLYKTTDYWHPRTRALSAVERSGAGIDWSLRRAPLSGKG